MPHCGDRTYNIDQLHDSTPEDISRRICVVWKYNLDHLGLRISNRFQCIFHQKPPTRMLCSMAVSTLYLETILQLKIEHQRSPSSRKSVSSKSSGTPSSPEFLS